jgi:hypothetical protein
MMPTAYKAKIPQTMSYPIGAAAVSAALGGVAQVSGASLWFGHSSYKTSLRPGHASRYAVFAALYRYISPSQFSANIMIERGDYEPKWTLHVYEVPRIYRHKIKVLLCAEGLPRLREWLLKMGSVTGREGACAFIISFDEAR